MEKIKDTETTYFSYLDLVNEQNMDTFCTLTLQCIKPDEIQSFLFFTTNILYTYQFDGGIAVIKIYNYMPG